MQFFGRHRFLSNFYNHPITYDGKTYQNAEAAFQAQKCKTDSERDKFVNLPPNEAKRLGRHVELRDDWENIKLATMYAIELQKFSDPGLLKLLLATDGALIEGNNWHDLYWGVDLATGNGENHLGKILMTIRQNAKDGQIYGDIMDTSKKLKKFTVMVEKHGSISLDVMAKDESDAKQIVESASPSSLPFNKDDLYVDVVSVTNANGVTTEF